MATWKLASGPQQVAASTGRPRAIEIDRPTSSGGDRPAARQSVPFCSFSNPLSCPTFVVFHLERAEKSNKWPARLGSPQPPVGPPRSNFVAPPASLSRGRRAGRLWEAGPARRRIRFKNVGRLEKVGRQVGTSSRALPTDHTNSYLARRPLSSPRSATCKLPPGAAIKFSRLMSGWAFGCGCGLGEDVLDVGQVYGRHLLPLAGRDDEMTFSLSNCQTVAGDVGARAARILRLFPSKRRGTLSGEPVDSPPPPHWS